MSRAPGGARPIRRIGLAFAALVVAAALGAAAFVPAVKGYALYHGWLPLQGRVAGHADDLPAGTARCAGCHDAPRPADAGYRAIPPLDAATLTTSVSRRAGPPSAYDRATFCTLLRDGNDPAFIMIDRTMPRFALSDGDCAALWEYVSRR